MEKRFFILITVFFHIFFALFQVYRRSTLTTYMYERQKIEAALEAAQEERKALMRDQEVLKERTALREYGKALGLEKIRLDQIKKMPA